MFTSKPHQEFQAETNFLQVKLVFVHDKFGKDDTRVKTRRQVWTKHLRYPIIFFIYFFIQGFAMAEYASNACSLSMQADGGREEKPAAFAWAFPHYIRQKVEIDLLMWAPSFTAVMSLFQPLPLRNLLCFLKGEFAEQANRIQTLWLLAANPLVTYIELNVFLWFWNYKWLFHHFSSLFTLWDLLLEEESWQCDWEHWVEELVEYEKDSLHCGFDWH